MCTQNWTTFRRKFRFITQRKCLLIVIFCSSLFLFSIFSLKMCYKILALSTLNRVCNKYQAKKYTGILCVELCDGESFTDFKCTDNIFKRATFTALKNNDVYVFKEANDVPNTIGWKDRTGRMHYPNLDDFQRIIRQYLTINYNITVDDEMVRTLLKQEIHINVPDQIESTWRLFKENNYIMGKLFEEESIFPSVIGTCGPMYATEHLNTLKESNLRNFIAAEWAKRLQLAMSIMEFIHRLSEIKPEPLKICKVELKDFGISSDKRIKYRNAQFIQFESHIDKILSDGTSCTRDTDCVFEDCIGKCDMEHKQCLSIQQNNNLQIVCNQIFQGSKYNPGLLVTNKTPKNLTRIIKICANPSEDAKYHMKNRPFAPRNEIASTLYNEIKRIYNEVTFHQ